MIIFSKDNTCFVKNNRIIKGIFCFIVLLAGLTACTTQKINVSNVMAIPAPTRIAVGPFANYSTTPLANRQVESMVAGLLQTKGFKNVVRYQHNKSCAKLLYCPDETITNHQIIRWARSNHIAYVFTGAANEWRYKVGLDGEPVAGTSLLLIEVNSGRTVWTAVGSVIGTTRSGLDLVGQGLLNNLLAGIAPTY